MKRHFQPSQQPSRQQTLAELHHQLRFASTPAERQAITLQIDFWRRHL